MPVHGFIFYEDVDNDTLDNLTPVASDESIFVSGDVARVREDFNKIIGYKALGANITRARIRAPSMNDKGGIEILPIDDAAENTSNFPPNWQIENPIQLTPTEKLEVETVNSGAAAIEQSVAIWVCDEVPTPIVGEEIFAVDFSVTGTCTARVWNNFAITLGQSLEAGEYAVVGMRAFSSSGLWARLKFGEGDARMMIPMSDDEAHIHDQKFINGTFGEWGRFKEDAPPRIDVFPDLTDSDISGVLYIIKVA